MLRSKRHDAIIEDAAFELRAGMRGARGLREAMLALADSIETGVVQQAYIVLVDPRVSLQRLRTEWEFLRRILRQDLGDRLGLLVFKAGQYQGIQPEIPGRIIDAARSLMATENRQLVDAVPLPRPDYPFVVFQILLRGWLLHQGPMTTKELTETAGCSYPTATRALAGLRDSIHRHKSRQIELERFPDREWGAIVALADRARSTRRFVDSSGQPQSPARLLERVQDLRIEGVAVGGAAGARYWYPDIDIVGEPRLDLTVHCPGRYLDDSFLQAMDPALIRIEDPHKPAAVVVHALRRTTPFYERGPNGEIWADPVECLLDLHDLRLDAQARALVARLQSAVA